MGGVTRRQFIKGTAATAIPAPFASFGIGCRKKRIGTFEESGRAAAEWLEKINYAPGPNDIERFRKSLSFELNHLVHQVLKTSNGNHVTTVTMNDFVFDFAYGRCCVFGKIDRYGKIGRNDVYLLEKLTGMETLKPNGFFLKGAKRIYLAHDRIREFALRTREEGVEAMRTTYRGESMVKIKRLVLAEQIEEEDFLRNTRQIGAETGLGNGTVQIMIAVWRMYPRKDDIAAPKEARQRICDGIHAALVHELVHAEMYGMKLLGRDEIFSMLADISYSKWPGKRLGKHMQHSFEAKPGDYDPYGNVLKELSQNGLEFRDVVLSADEERIRSIARKALDGLCIAQFGKPFEQIVDVSLFGEAMRFAESAC